MMAVAHVINNLVSDKKNDQKVVKESFLHKNKCAVVIDGKQVLVRGEVNISYIHRH